MRSEYSRCWLTLLATCGTQCCYVVPRNWTCGVEIRIFIEFCKNSILSRGSKNGSKVMKFEKNRDSHPKNRVRKLTRRHLEQKLIFWKKVIFLCFEKLWFLSILKEKFKKVTKNVWNHYNEVTVLYSIIDKCIDSITS